MGRPVSFEERFWSKVDVRGPHECWRWGAFTNARGYGVTCRDGRLLPAPAAALGLCEPKPFPKAYALHHCDNPSCCNPLHLYWGTAADNAADRERRKRSGAPKRRGAANKNFVDLTGRRYGRLLVLALVGSKMVKDASLKSGRRSVGTTWLCRCDCGAEVVKYGRYLTGGDTKSCGCLGPQMARARMLGPGNPARAENRGTCHGAEAHRLSEHRWVAP